MNNLIIGLYGRFTSFCFRLSQALEFARTQGKPIQTSYDPGKLKPTQKSVQPGIYGFASFQKRNYVDL